MNALFKKKCGQTFSGIVHSKFIKREREVIRKRAISIAVFRNMEKDISLSVTTPII
jgi:hypothetical protein